MAFVPIPITGESVPTQLLTFEVTLPNKSVVWHKMDCLTNATVEGLKADLQLLIKIPVERQKWKFGEIVMTNDTTIANYHFEDYDSNQTVCVKCS